MDNKTAFWLALIIVLVLLVDTLYFDQVFIVFLGKQLARVSEWIAFWHEL